MITWSIVFATKESPGWRPGSLLVALPPCGTLRPLMAERRYTRVRAGVGLILTIDGKAEPCLTRDISRGGMFVVTRRPAYDGQTVQLEVIHEGKRLKAEAQVVTVAEDGLGLSFVGATEGFRNAIRTVMDEMVAARSTDTELVPGAISDLQVHWSPVEGSKWWAVWHRTRHKCELTNLTLDGASMRSKQRPDVGETVVLELQSRAFEGGAVTASAEIIRHTNGGFAVYFLAASVEFRRAVSMVRRHKFGRSG